MQYNCWSLRCSWRIACRRCSNYIFILHSTCGVNILHKNNCKTRWETFKFWDLVRLILENLRYLRKLCHRSSTPPLPMKTSIKQFLEYIFVQSITKPPTDCKIYMEFVSLPFRAAGDLDNFWCNSGEYFVKLMTFPFQWTNPLGRQIAVKNVINCKHVRHRHFQSEGPCSVSLEPSVRNEYTHSNVMYLAFGMQCHGHSWHLIYFTYWYPFHEPLTRYRAVMHAGIANKRFPFKSVAGKTFPPFPAHAQPSILRIWQEAHARRDFARIAIEIANILFSMQ